MSVAVRSVIGVIVATGLLSFAACTPPTPSMTPAEPAQLGSTAPTQPEPHFAADAPIDSAQSQQLTNYLHSHQLPLVGARVLSSNAGARQVIVYGYVATPFGKADAADRSREFLNDPNTQVDNRIKVEPDLASNATMGPPPDNSGQSNSDLQAYQNQQQTAQQQQYMNQGSSSSSGLMMFLPLFGMFGGGGSGFGFGTGGGGYGYGSPYGGYGPGYSPYGPGYGYSPYGPSYPPPGYGYPYGP